MEPPPLSILRARNAGDQVVEGEETVDPTESPKRKHLKSEDGRCSDSDTEKIADSLDFEFSVEDSKDLLSLNEELSSILDPKVGSLNLIWYVLCC